jgi:hypothetical protein
MESPSRSESSTESADIRRVEFEDGRVVHLPNNMPDERVREVRSSQHNFITVTTRETFAWVQVRTTGRL